MRANKKQNKQKNRWLKKKKKEKDESKENEELFQVAIGQARSEHAIHIYK